jgi:hypothetical protein
VHATGILKSPTAKFFKYFLVLQSPDSDLNPHNFENPDSQRSEKPNSDPHQSDADPSYVMHNPAFALLARTFQSEKKSG